MRAQTFRLASTALIALMGALAAPAGHAAEDGAPAPRIGLFDAAGAARPLKVAGEFEAYATGEIGSVLAPSVIAYAASQGGQAIPSIYWQYNTGGLAQGALLPSAHDGGAQLAFLQTRNGQREVVLLKWSRSATLIKLTPLAPENYRDCVAPCMTAIALPPASRPAQVALRYNSRADALEIHGETATQIVANAFVSGTPQAVPVEDAEDVTGSLGKAR